jgi:flagellar biosynthesis protein FliR
MRSVIGFIIGATIGLILFVIFLKTIAPRLDEKISKWMNK